MAKITGISHWGSKGAINRAGDAIRRAAVSDRDAIALELWRMAHRDVIHVFEATLRARARDQDVQVAQRLKRRRTIVDKLARYPRMQLARMDDVAGCRLIFPSIEALHAFRDSLHKARFNHVLKNEINTIILNIRRSVDIEEYTIFMSIAQEKSVQTNAMDY